MPDPTPGVPGGDPNPPAAWFAGITDTTVAEHATKHGWNAVADPTAAFLAAAAAHRTTEQALGVPASQVLRLPADPAADPDGMRSIYQRLGAPVDAKEYAFEGVDFGTPELTAKFTDSLRASAAGLNLTKDQAAGVAKAFHTFLGTHGEDDAKAKTEAITAAATNLNSEWGANKEANEFIAKQAATALETALGPKFGPRLASLITEMRAGGNGDVVAELFRVIGTKIGEDKFVGGGGNGSRNTVMSQHEAQTEKDLLVRDAGWVARYNAGGMAERKQMTALNTLIHGDDTAESRGIANR